MDGDSLQKYEDYHRLCGVLIAILISVQGQGTEELILCLSLVEM